MYIKPFEQLAFYDDFMFGHILQNPEICKGILERLLGMKIRRIEYPELQKEIAPYYTAKGIRLDVYASDGSTVYDMEIQNYSQPDIGRRTRYYQSMLDIDNLIKGQDYSALKESYIIFLCRFDPFKKGIPCYTFSRTCSEAPEAELRDGAVLKIFNCEAYAKAEDWETKTFLKFVETNKADSTFTRRIYDMVETQKTAEGAKQYYYSWGLAERDARYRGRREGEIIGRKKGAALTSIQNAKNLLAMNVLTHEQIAQAVGLPLEKIEELAAAQEHKSE